MAFNLMDDIVDFIITNSLVQINRDSYPSVTSYDEDVDCSIIYSYSYKNALLRSISI